LYLSECAARDNFMQALQTHEQQSLEPGIVSWRTCGATPTVTPHRLVVAKKWASTLHTQVDLARAAFRVCDVREWSEAMRKLANGEYVRRYAEVDDVRIACCRVMDNVATMIGAPPEYVKLT
jgi:hypothetical protein